MYEQLEDRLDAILKAVAKCPEILQPKCFEILLKGYVDEQLAALTPAKKAIDKGSEEKKLNTPITSEIPPELLPRLRTAAKRLGLEVASFEKLFDFSADPVSFHAFSVPGANNAEKSRHIALLVAAKSYLTTGTWSADWKEVKARCVDQNCYDASNFGKFLKQGDGSVFKSVDPGKSVDLSSNGINEAETLLKTLASEG